MEIKTPYPKPKDSMKKEFLKILLFIWMTDSLYFLYEIWIDVGWMADAMHAYMKFVMEHIRH